MGGFDWSQGKDNQSLDSPSPSPLPSRKVSRYDWLDPKTKSASSVSINPRYSFTNHNFNKGKDKGSGQGPGPKLHFKSKALRYHTPSLKVLLDIDRADSLNEDTTIRAQQSFHKLLEETQGKLKFANTFHTPRTSNPKGELFDDGESQMPLNKTTSTTCLKTKGERTSFVRPFGGTDNSNAVSKSVTKSIVCVDALEFLSNKEKEVAEQYINFEAYPTTVKDKHYVPMRKYLVDAVRAIPYQEQPERWKGAGIEAPTLKNPLNPFKSVIPRKEEIKGEPYYGIKKSLLLNESQVAMKRAKVASEEYCKFVPVANRKEWRPKKSTPEIEEEEEDVGEDSEVSFDETDVEVDGNEKSRNLTKTKSKQKQNKKHRSISKSELKRRLKKFSEDLTASESSFFSIPGPNSSSIEEMSSRSILTSHECGRMTMPISLESRKETNKKFLNCMEKHRHELEMKHYREELAKTKEGDKDVGLTDVQDKVELTAQKLQNLENDTQITHNENLNNKEKDEEDIIDNHFKNNVDSVSSPLSMASSTGSLNGQNPRQKNRPQPKMTLVKEGPLAIKISQDNERVNNDKCNGNDKQTLTSPKSLASNFSRDTDPFGFNFIDAMTFDPALSSVDIHTVEEMMPPETTSEVKANQIAAKQRYETLQNGTHVAIHRPLVIDDDFRRRMLAKRKAKEEQIKKTLLAAEQLREMEEKMKEQKLLQEQQEQISIV